MKGKLTAILIFACCFRLSAGAPPEFLKHVDAGFEWGYSATFCNVYHFNYISEDSGSRIDVHDKDFTFKSNGHLYGYVGAKFCKCFVTDLMIGWAGIYEERRVNPLTVRFSWFPQGFDNDGIKLFIENGSFFGNAKTRNGLWLSKAGAGRRLILDDFIALDASISAQLVSDHPLGVFDMKSQVSVPDANLRRSDCHYTCINFTLALSF